MENPTEARATNPSQSQNELFTRESANGNWRSVCHKATMIGDLSFSWYEISPQNRGGTEMRQGICAQCSELQNLTQE